MVHWNVTFDLDIDGGSIEYAIESIQEVLGSMSGVGFGQVIKVRDVDAEKDFEDVGDVLDTTTS